jgi:hypothetical protein
MDKDEEIEALRAQSDALAPERDAAKSVAVRVKPGVIEREVWEAMVWAARSIKPQSGVLPDYTNGGNSDAETEARRAAARILAVLEPAPVSDEALIRAALEAAAKAAKSEALLVVSSAVACHGEMSSYEVESSADDVADAIRALAAKYKDDIVAEGRPECFYTSSKGVNTPLYRAKEPK